MSGGLSQSVRENIDKWLPHLTTDVLFCADANLNDKTGVCRGDSGGPAILRFLFSFQHCTAVYSLFCSPHSNVMEQSFNKHCEVLVSCSGRKLDDFIEAQRSACQLMELHASYCNCMQAKKIQTFMKCNVPQCDPNGTACKLM